MIVSIKRLARGKNKISFVGLDQAGKTCLLKRLMDPNSRLDVDEPPTLGHETTVLFLPMSTKEEKERNKANHRFIVYDLGGQSKFRHLWMEKVKTSAIIIFVVDCTRHDRFNEARKEFEQNVMPALTSQPILLVATKQDLPNGLSANEIVSQVIPEEIRNKHKVNTVDASAKTGLGLDLIETWLLARLR